MVRIARTMGEGICTERIKNSYDDLVQDVWKSRAGRRHMSGQPAVASGKNGVSACVPESSLVIWVRVITWVLLGLPTFVWQNGRIARANQHMYACVLVLQIVVINYYFYPEEKVGVPASHPTRSYTLSPRTRPRLRYIPYPQPACSVR